MKTLYGFPVVEIDGAKMLYGEWTTEPPTREGLYRVSMSKDNEFWAEVIKERGKLFVVHIVHFKRQGFSVRQLLIELVDKAHWLGPLPVPAPPSEGE